MVRKVYSSEFRADAVALYRSDSSHTISRIARDLGIQAETLRKWNRTAAGGVPGASGRGTEIGETTTPEELRARIAALEAELAAARKDNATLAMERDILRKATKFFASEMTW